MLRSSSCFEASVLADAVDGGGGLALKDFGIHHSGICFVPLHTTSLFLLCSNYLIRARGEAIEFGLN